MIKKIGSVFRSYVLKKTKTFEDFESANDFVNKIYFNDNCDHEEFYLLEIRNDERVLDCFYIYKKDDIMKYKELIKERCRLLKASAHLVLTRRIHKDVAIGMINRISMLIRQKKYRPMRTLYDKVCKITPSKDKYSAVDVSENVDMKLTFFINNNASVETYNSKLVLTNCKKQPFGDDKIDYLESIPIYRIL